LKCAAARMSIYKATPQNNFSVRLMYDTLPHNIMRYLLYSNFRLKRSDVPRFHDGDSLSCFSKLQYIILLSHIATVLFLVLIIYYLSSHPVQDYTLYRFLRR
jgi:hypothetical protein